MHLYCLSCARGWTRYVHRQRWLGLWRCQTAPGRGSLEVEGDVSAVLSHIYPNVNANWAQRTWEKAAAIPGLAPSRFV